ncbi:aminopeptidase [Coralloluteibacterium thermophilus]|uniref:Aminopeptidase n=1 Tax=Coralloluteibacterium thermophilum TaxID=2707049 RepID=A0ABV9NQW3_9GAMM
MVRGLRVLRATALPVLLLAVTGCASLGYYGHLARGQAALLRQRVPIAAVVDDARADPVLRARLAEVLEARAFAVSHLGLPDNASYTRYVALDRPWVSWAVYAAREFSTQPALRCFPVAGCVPYVGYFSPERARAEAQRLRARGLETWIGGVPAYSTLGWFADPVFSSMLRGGQDELIEIVFHELAHQWLYVRDDTVFNESLASFVGRQGLVEWRRSRGEPEPDPARAERERAFVTRVLALREDLAALYARPLDPATMRILKAAHIADFRAWYAAQRAGPWRDERRFDAWANAPIDNAALAPFGLYDRWVPAFEGVFEAVGQDWGRFRAAVEQVARMPPAVRSDYLDAWAAAMEGPPRDAVLR